MRVNIYAEEMTDRIEIVGKEIDGRTYSGLRFYLELPVTLPNGENYAGPFYHRPGDDDSAAVTFWGKQDLRALLRHALAMLDAHYAEPADEHERRHGLGDVPAIGPLRPLTPEQTARLRKALAGSADAPMVPPAPEYVDAFLDALPPPAADVVAMCPVCCSWAREASDSIPDHHPRCPRGPQAETVRIADGADVLTLRLPQQPPES